MNAAKLKETIAKIVKEESEYQVFFKKALEKAGKSITDMSDDEKKDFFNKIDAAWDGKGEKNEGNAFGAAVTAAKEKGEDEFEVGGKTYKVEEGKKRFRQQNGIGKAKYTISYHDGVKKHKDGSDFFDIQIFKNQKDVDTFRKALLQKGFVEESVDVVNEGYSTEEKRIVLMAARKIAKYMNRPLGVAMGYVIGAAQELERDIERGKVKESVNEGRAFINAAKKAKAEGKTEFEFNGKTYPVTLKESTINEDANMNKKVKAYLDKGLSDLKRGGSNHLFAVMHVLMGALTDANFHSEAKKVPAIFGSKAKYEGDPMGKQDAIRIYEDMGENIASICKWDGEDIAKAVGFYTSMSIGRPLGQKIENLV